MLMLRVASLLPGLLLWLSEAADNTAGTESGCIITAASCRNFPDFGRTQFSDEMGEEHLRTGDVDAACLKRAEDFHHWCGNSAADGATVASTYAPGQVSQVYHPSACEAGWSQWDAFCYKHFWEKKTWWDAERLCREKGRGSHLASVHSQAENRFVFTLTSGLSAWIGYNDLDKDTHYKWTDSTNDDFSNWAKNCTGREHEPDCKPEEKAQQWYDWEGHDEGTYVCKRTVLLPVALLRNVTSAVLLAQRWEELLPVLAASVDGGGAVGNMSTPAAPGLKMPDIPMPEPLDGTPDLPPPMPKPKLVAPSMGSFF